MPNVYVFSRWIKEVQGLLKQPSDERIWLLSDEHSKSGILGFTKCLRKEPGGHRIR